jgi:hypothetical protein
MRPDHALPPPSTPGPNPHNKLASPIVNTPPAIFNTPSKLDRFLQSVEKNGIPGVVLFHLVLSERGYGPDIMHLIKISDLVDIGMPPGDAIRLKEYAVRWWADEHQHVAKRPCEVKITPTLPLPAGSTPCPSGCASNSVSTMGVPQGIMVLMSDQATVKMQTTLGGSIRRSC